MLTAYGTFMNFCLDLTFNEQGSFGVILRMKHSIDNFDYAIKIIAPREKLVTICLILFNNKVSL